MVSDIDFNVVPDRNESYGFSGQVKAELAGNSLITELRTYTDLKYVGDEDDYYIFELPFQHQVTSISKGAAEHQ